MNHLTKVKLTQKLNEEELKKGIPINASWHSKYSNSAYIYIGGFPFEITEGDLVIVFSQYGEIVDCRIVRDKITGKNKGFGFICYEDQKSTILAVDNLNGANICGRIIRVDHVEQFKIPKEYFDIEDSGEENSIYKPSGPDGKGWGEDRILSQEEIESFELLRQNELKQEIRKVNNNLSNNHLMDEDEKWEIAFKTLIDSEKNKKSEFTEVISSKENLKKEKKIKKKNKNKKHKKLNV